MILSNEDWAFINALNIRFPFLCNSFKEALAIPAIDRYDWAQDRLYDVPRAGYVLKGVPEHAVETVGDHTLDAIGLATLHTPEGYDRDMVERMILIHDLTEAIVSDFTIHDPITKAEKKRIEAIAAYVIFEAFPDELALLHLYEERTSPEAQLAKDIEQAQILFKVLDYQDYFPHLKDNFVEFWDSLSRGWLTDTGRKIHRSALSIHNDFWIPGDQEQACAI